MSVFKKVVKTSKRTSITGTTTYWDIVLECGHSASSIYCKNGWRGRTKPAPKRMKCSKCQFQEVHHG